jgi:GTP 3',8-cyclase
VFSRAPSGGYGVPPIPRSKTMFIAHGTNIEYLRMSLTSGCAMRCVYCRPALDRGNGCADPLTSAEIEQVVRRLVERHGVRKVRLTGGDPSSRPDLVEIIERVANIDGVRDLSMTTHGLTLAKMAHTYRKAGLQRVNISLDTLDPDRFQRMTGVRGLSKVTAGIDAALDAGLGPVKLNTVVLRDENLQELPALIRFAQDRDLLIRFIELMPMGPLAPQWKARYVSATQIRQSLSDLVGAWRLQDQAHDSATPFRARLHDGTSADIGFITPMSCSFCHACNRLRITVDGGIYPCLMDQPRGSITSAMRPVFDADRFDELLLHALGKKAPEHPAEGFGIMTRIGG